MADALHLVALCGSLRKGSFNRSLLSALPPLAPEGMVIEVLEWGHLPVLNTDLEVDGVPPAEVRALQQRIRAADGVLICTPEYAMGVPGSLKNALDWTVSSADLRLKPIMLVTASLSGKKAQASLLETLTVLEGVITPETTVLVQFARTKVDPEAKITDAHALADVKAALDAFLAHK